jgi:hypothetical protein
MVKWRFQFCCRVVWMNDFEIALRPCLNIGLVGFSPILYEMMEMPMCGIECIHSNNLNLQMYVKDC